jgi:hypothetical protein
VAPEGRTVRLPQIDGDLSETIQFADHAGVVDEIERLTRIGDQIEQFLGAVLEREVLVAAVEDREAVPGWIGVDAELLRMDP